MVGVAVSSEPAVRLVQGGRQAAALDTLLQARDTGLFDALIVVTNDPVWASNLPLDVIVDLDDTRHPFHFGRRLAGVIEFHNLTHVLYMGAGAAPLLSRDALVEVVEQLKGSNSILITNNLHSTDWAGFAPAGVLSEYTHRVGRDNMLAWVLHREAGLPVVSQAPSAASRLDIDTPTDLLLLARHPRCMPKLASYLSGQQLPVAQLDQAIKVLRQEGTHVIVAGRVASSTWAALERGTLCWVRMLAEERGMVASGRQARNQVHSVLGVLVEQLGLAAFFELLAEWSDAVFWDNRVLMAHFGLWPSDDDRFASDLGWVDCVKDPFLKEFAQHVHSAPIPVLCGGHSLVSGGLLALLEMVSPT